MTSLFSPVIYTDRVACHRLQKKYELKGSEVLNISQLFRPFQ